MRVSKKLRSDGDFDIFLDGVLMGNTVTELFSEYLPMLQTIFHPCDDNHLEPNGQYYAIDWNKDMQDEWIWKKVCAERIRKNLRGHYVFYECMIRSTIREIEGARNV